MTHLTTAVSSRLTRNSEAFASEFLGNLSEMHSYICKLISHTQRIKYQLQNFVQVEYAKVIAKFWN